MTVGAVGGRRTGRTRRAANTGPRRRCPRGRRTGRGRGRWTRCRPSAAAATARKTWTCPRRPCYSDARCRTAAVAAAACCRCSACSVERATCLAPWPRSLAATTTRSSRPTTTATAATAARPQRRPICPCQCPR